MKLSRTALVIPLAGLLLVGGAGAVFAATATPAAPSAPVVPAVDQPTPTPAPAASAKPAVGPALTNVLDELVTKGTITSGQKTAIVDALTSQRAERQAEMAQIRGFLADGEITQAEIDQLPGDSPLRTLSALMADGKITLAELQTLGRGWMRTMMGGANGAPGANGGGMRGGGMGQGMGGRGGMMGNGFGQGPAVTPAP